MEQSNYSFINKTSSIIQFCLLLILINSLFNTFQCIFRSCFNFLLISISRSQNRIKIYRKLSYCSFGCIFSIILKSNCRQKPVVNNVNVAVLTCSYHRTVQWINKILRFYTPPFWRGKEVGKQIWKDMLNTLGVQCLSYAIVKHSFDQETKHQPMEWRHSGSPKPKKVRVQKSAGRVIESVFWDYQGVIMIDFLEKSRTISRSTIRRYWPLYEEKIMTRRSINLLKGILFLQDNAPAHIWYSSDNDSVTIAFKAYLASLIRRDEGLQIPKPLLFSDLELSINQMSPCPSVWSFTHSGIP